MKRDYLSYSALKMFAKSPNHYLAYTRREFKPSPAMQLGSLVHILVLEEDKLAERYAISPEVNKRTKAGKEAYAKFVEEAGEKEVVLESQVQEAQVIADVIKKHPIAKQVPASATEFEYEVKGEINGFPFLGYADILSKNYIYDLKTCQDASPNKFQRDAASLQYHLQGAIYRELLGLPFRWIAVETSDPFNVQVYEQDEESYKRERDRLYQLVESFKEWDGEPREYSDKVLTLTLPPWA